jgi:membrane fusion protein (multidrug efflux system)
VASRRATADAAARVVEQRAAAVDQAKQRAIETQSNSPRNIEVQHATVDTRIANVKAAKAQVDQAQLNLSYCKIVAATDGIIGDKTVELGQHLAPGQELFALTQTDDIWITANFKETQIRNMHRGESVTVQVDALSQKFDAFVEELPGATGAKYSLLPPENATGNYVKVVQRLPVRIRVKAGQPHADRLRPGMSVEPKVWIHTR